MSDTQGTPAMFTYTPIGTVHPSFSDIAGMPIQPNGARGTLGTIEILTPYREGLRDLSGFERLFLIYTFHQCSDHSLLVRPFLDPAPRGVFATRSPKRPNAIGLSVVRLLTVDTREGLLPSKT